MHVLQEAQDHCCQHLKVEWKHHMWWPTALRCGVLQVQTPARTKAAGHRDWPEDTTPSLCVAARAVYLQTPQGMSVTISTMHLLNILSDFYFSLSAKNRREIIDLMYYVTSQSTPKYISIKMSSCQPPSCFATCLLSR